MAWLKVTGMIPPEPGSYWSEGTLTVEPAYREHLDWSDGGRRAAWPITGTLAGAGTRWASTGDNGDVLIPGADVGVSVEPPVVELTVRLRDGVTGEWKTSRLVGIVEATAPGEWNINAPLKNTLRHVETPGVPAGALRTTDVGVVVPSMAEFGGLGGRVGLLEKHIASTRLPDNSINANATDWNAFPYGESYMTVSNAAGLNYPEGWGLLHTVRLADDTLAFHQWFMGLSRRVYYRTSRAAQVDLVWEPWMEEPRLVSRVVTPTYTVERWSDGVQRVRGWEQGGQLPPNNWTILQWTLPMPFVDRAFYVEARVTEGLGGLGYAVFETAEVLPLDAGRATARAKHNHPHELPCVIHYHAVGRWF